MDHENLPYILMREVSADGLSEDNGASDCAE